MIEHDHLDRLLTDVLIEDAPREAPDRLVPETVRALRDVRRRPRWLAYLKEPPMRISSTLAVGSPTVRLTTVLLATVMLVVVATGAVVAGATFLSGPSILVVDQGDPAAYQTITEAVSLAQDGDTVLVKPGTYAGGVAITANIDLRGDGERGDIVLEFSADGPTVSVNGEPFAYGILLDGSRAHVENFTVRGPETDGTDPAVIALYIDGGAPVIESIDVVLSGDRWDYGGGWYRRSAVRITGGSSAVVRDSTWDGLTRIVGLDNSPTLEGNTVSGQFISIFDGGQTPIIRGNILLGTAAIRWGGTGSGGLIEDNDIDGWIGIGESSNPTVRGNRIKGGDLDPDSGSRSAAIHITSGAAPIVESNEITDSTFGIEVNGFSASPEIRGNTIRGSTDAAIVVDRGAAPTIDDNVIEGNATGIEVIGTSTPVVSGNTLCGNGTNLVVPDGSDLTLEGNEVCEG